MTFYPSHRYHISGVSRLIQNPDQEPQGASWRDRPWPPVVAPVELPECCAKLKAQFDGAFAVLLAERDALAVKVDVLELTQSMENEGEEGQPEGSKEQSEGSSGQPDAVRKPGRPAGSKGKKGLEVTPAGTSN